DSREQQQSRVYRVDVEISTPRPDFSEHAKGLKAVTLQLAWPVDGETGKLLGITNNNRESMTYFVTTLSGPSWEKIDPSFEPTIDL
ncbi:MAG: hypothetical protein ACI8UO_005977, partial [Verrucomicrobiales bacterium]